MGLAAIGTFASSVGNHKRFYTQRAAFRNQPVKHIIRHELHQLPNDAPQSLLIVGFTGKLMCLSQRICRAPKSNSLGVLVRLYRIHAEQSLQGFDESFDVTYVGQRANAGLEILS